MKKTATKKSRKLTGTVVSDKMDKTVVVSVLRVRVASKYKKQFNFYKKFKAHDAANAYHIGDKVVIEETRPLSKEKNWKVIAKILPRPAKTASVKTPTEKTMSDEEGPKEQDS